VTKGRNPTEAGWHHTGCALCGQNCGLLAKVEEDRIVKVRPDKANPRSRGYVCRKGMNVPSFQHHADRLTHPLKRTDSGFEKVSWQQAYDEIGQRLRSIVDDHGPRAFAYLGGGGQGAHFEAAFATTLLKALGSKYHYGPLAQELTGYFWTAGRMLGRQNRFPIPDEHHADMLLAVGWNGMVSHQMPRAPIVLREFSNNPDKLLAVIDPRRSETAQIANIHVPVRPGADALLARAMIAIILQEGWADQRFLADHTTGFDAVRPWFEDFAVEPALTVCQVDPAAVRELCRQLGKRRWCMHVDLGVFMNRHSTLTTYLYMLLVAVCGRFGVTGGNVIPGSMVPLGSHTDERDKSTWRTQTTDLPAIMGYFPPNVLPAEIVSDHPERIRAVVTSSSNPLRSYADTTAYEEAFGKLDLLVTIDVAMTETAALSHYVLPARSAYEAYDSTFFTWTYPEIFFQLRRPLVEPEGVARETGDILTGIADAAGLVPPIPKALAAAASQDRVSYAAALLTTIRKSKAAREVLPFMVAKTLGKTMGSAHLAALWGLLLSAPASFRADAARAGFPMPPLWDGLRKPGRVGQALRSMIHHRDVAPLGILAPQVAHAEMLFETIMARPEGLIIGKVDQAAKLAGVATDDGRVHLYIPEMAEWIAEITPEAEGDALEPAADYPLILNAGRHAPMVANTQLRNPAWHRGRRACTLAVHPDDAASLAVADGEMVRITTAAGSETIELEISDETRPGQVLIPHGFGLSYQDRTYGVNVNRLTSASHRDRIAATPLHRYVPCRVDKIDG
jgi:anaerobic selenocysteine-containing dehydrogenase